jgi:hypothetical protein
MSVRMDNLACRLWVKSRHCGISNQCPKRSDVRFVPITDIARCAVENKRFRHNYASVRWKSLLDFCVGGAFADIAPDCKRDETPV